MTPPAPITEAAPSQVDELSRASGLPLHAFKQGHVTKQVERALAKESASDSGELAQQLGRNPGARSRFRSAIAISVSGNLRDPRQFELLERDVIPTIVEPDGAVRVWSAGCADGSELYDVGGLLQRRGVIDRVYLLGSDILEENIRRASGQDGPTATPAVRARVRWERRDLTSEPAPPGAWRLILCRNLAIYLRPEVRDGLHRKLAGALARGGFLMLGRSERIADPAAVGLEAAGPNVYRKPL